MKQTSEEFMNEMLKDIDGEVKSSPSELFVQMEKNLNDKIEEMQNNIFEKIANINKTPDEPNEEDVSYETSEDEIETDEIEEKKDDEVE